ncbi:hypothetical protein BDR26DRAFT_861685 [Obelidium mucronatum]|nr:hypothetical protein BDR26DRAFT_861685 [Obelidium mucronatum]
MSIKSTIYLDASCKTTPIQYTVTTSPTIDCSKVSFSTCQNSGNGVFVSTECAIVGIDNDLSKVRATAASIFGSKYFVLTQKYSTPACLDDDNGSVSAMLLGVCMPYSALGSYVSLSTKVYQMGGNSVATSSSASGGVTEKPALVVTSCPGGVLATGGASSTALVPAIATFSLDGSCATIPINGNYAGVSARIGNGLLNLGQTVSRAEKGVEKAGFALGWALIISFILL